MAIVEARAGEDDNRLVKELEKAKKRFTAKLKERVDQEGKEKYDHLRGIGVDQLFVDEADLYKNLFYATNMDVSFKQNAYTAFSVQTCCHAANSAGLIS